MDREHLPGSTESIGLVAFSFGLREDEPNPSNIELGNAVNRIVSTEPTSITVVSQWEIAKALDGTNIDIERVVNPNDDGTYLDSVGVWDVAKSHFSECGINTVIPVAHPYIHLPHVKRMIKKDGFDITSRHIGRIGFDNSELNMQPWTRSRLAFATQAVRLQFLNKEHGYGRQT